MTGDKQATSMAEPESILSPEEIQRIRDKAQRRCRAEDAARKRKTPPWDPDLPWRLLQHTYIATLKATKEISTNDFEAILGRRSAWMTASRDDLIFELPNR